MNELEFGLDCSDTLLRNSAIRHAWNDLDSKQVVGITFEAIVAISRNLLLPVCLRDWGSDIVGMKTSIRGDMVQSNDSTILEELGRDVAPCSRTSDSDIVCSHGLSLVFEKEDVVFVLVRVQGDLLLLAAPGIHVSMRMQIAALGIVMSNADFAAVVNIGWHILHSLRVESRLELRRHEAIALPRIDETCEVDCEHRYVKADRDNNQAENSGK